MYPYSPADFQSLPSDHLVTIGNVVNSKGQIGILNIGKTTFWKLLNEGVIPQGRENPLDTRPTNPKYWEVAQILEVRDARLRLRDAHLETG